MQEEKLSNVKQAIVIAHVMRRFLCHFEPHERTSHINLLLTRLTKMLKKRENQQKRVYICYRVRESALDECNR